MSVKSGKRGERIAKEYLLKQGYDIIEENWYSHHREIDLIAVAGNFIVFVEVKLRQADAADDASEAMTKRKQTLLTEAANDYMQRIHEDKEARFDFIAVYENPIGGKERVQHIKNAFYPELS